MTTASHLSNQTICTIGILGGGQLGMMLAQSALQLGYRCVFLEDSPHCPASHYGKVYSTQQLEDFVAAADVFTLEFENTPVKTCEWLKELSDKGEKQGMYPPPKALEVAQDRLKEKTLFNELGIKTVPFMAVASKEDLKKACDELGLPIVLKTSRGGYDGKGQFVLKDLDDIDAAWSELGGAVTGTGVDGFTTPRPAPLIAEGFIKFSREVSIIAVRAQGQDGQVGQIRVYDLVENHHHHGILAKTQAPAVGTSHLLASATAYIETLMTHLDYVGVMALELFVSKGSDGKEMLLANEIAPRVHNSGHWSIEGAVTSQFENHIRAVVGLPLGDTDNVHPSIMINILGQYPNVAEVLAIDGAHYHTYHKEERENRKIGHVTLMPNDVAKLDTVLKQLVAVLPNKVGLDK